MARVFIGIPTVNRADLVQETVRSVLAQTFGDFRVVVSDNASDGNTPERVAGFVDELADPRVRFHQQPRNVGEYGQGRFFFEACRDEDYFIILHDDDVLEPTYLAKAVDALDRAPSAAYFVANPYLIALEGEVSGEQTQWYLKAHGRRGRGEGEIEVLGTLLRHGLTPISGTCFRTRVLRASGFVDPDCHGNYPFEFNLLLRIGERDTTAWFCPDQLIRFRFHAQSARNYLRLFDNPTVVGTMIRLLERRTFAGANERRRLVILEGLYRAMALVQLRLGDVRRCRALMKQALATHAASFRTCVAAGLAFVAPRLLRAVRPAVGEAQTAPVYDACAAPEAGSAENA